MMYFTFAKCHQRYHGSLKTSRSPTFSSAAGKPLLKRERIKRDTIKIRRCSIKGTPA